MATKKSHFFKKIFFCNNINFASSVSSNGENFFLISQDLINWNEISILRGCEITDISFGNNKYIAVCSSSPIEKPRIYISENGIDWNPIFNDSFKDYKFSSIAFGNVFVATVYKNKHQSKIIRSFDGIEWEKIPQFSNLNYSSIIFDDTKNLFIACASGCEYTTVYNFINSYSLSKIIYSLDGGFSWNSFPDFQDSRTWKKIIKTKNNIFFGIAFDMSPFESSNEENINKKLIIRSNDGFFWEDLNSYPEEIFNPKEFFWNNISSGNNILLANIIKKNEGHKLIRSLDNGLNWEFLDFNFTTENLFVEDISYNENKNLWVLSCSHNKKENFLWFSSDGENWEKEKIKILIEN